MGLILAFGMFDGIRIMGAVSGLLAFALIWSSKTFAEHLISEIDPGYLETIRSQYR